MHEVGSRLVEGVAGDGIPDDAHAWLVGVACSTPPDQVLPLLLKFLSIAGEPGLYDLARLALRISSSNLGYTPFLTALEQREPVAGILVGGSPFAGRALRGKALALLFDVLAIRGTEHSANYLVYEQAQALLACHRDAVIDHFVHRVGGPSLMAADAIQEVFLAGGPCPPLEQLWAQWIEDGRFDGAIDAPDRSTSAQFLGGTLERCVLEGVFPGDWWLLDRALAHWSQLLGDSDPTRHRIGLDNMATLMMFKHDLAGRLPSGVLDSLPPDSPAARAIDTGFRAIGALRRGHGRSAESLLLKAEAWLHERVHGV